MSVDMASPPPEDGIRRVSISPTDTEPESDDMEPSADPLPMEIDERPGVIGSYEARFPAETPVAPPAWWGSSKRKRSFFTFRPLKRLAFTGCIPPGQEHLS